MSNDPRVTKGKRPRGICPQCGMNVPVKKDGTVQLHHPKIFRGKGGGTWCNGWPPPPPKVIKVNPKIWKQAMFIAKGDRSRIKVISATHVEIKE